MGPTKQCLELGKHRVKSVTGEADVTSRGGTGLSSQELEGMEGGGVGEKSRRCSGLGTKLTGRRSIRPWKLRFAVGSRQ